MSWRTLHYPPRGCFHARASDDVPISLWAFDEGAAQGRQYPSGPIHLNVQGATVRLTPQQALDLAAELGCAATLFAAMDHLQLPEPEVSDSSFGEFLAASHPDGQPKGQAS